MRSSKIQNGITAKNRSLAAWPALQARRPTMTKRIALTAAAGTPDSAATHSGTSCCVHSTHGRAGRGVVDDRDLEPSRADARERAAAR